MDEQVFLIRLWCEHREIERAAPEFRGLIEHVMSGERRYLTDIDIITQFIAAYLEEMGVKVSLRWQSDDGIEQQS